MLNRIAQTLLKQRKPEWIVLRQRLPKTARKGTRIVLCSFGRFVTFGYCAQAYVGHGPGMHELLPEDDVTVLNDDDVAFVISLIASFCQSFERVFLKGTHKHGRVQVSQYNSWRAQQQLILMMRKSLTDSMCMTLPVIQPVQNMNRKTEVVPCLLWVSCPLWVSAVFFNAVHTSPPLHDATDYRY